MFKLCKYPIVTGLHSKVVIMVSSNVYIFVSMTLNTTHVRGKRGYHGRMTLKLSWCVHVRYLHMCAKFRGSTTYSCRENPYWGIFDLVPLDFSSKFHQSYKVSKSCFSTGTFLIDFICLLMTGVNIAGSVFLPKNTFKEHGCQFLCRSFQFVIKRRCRFEISRFKVMFVGCLLCSFSTAMNPSPYSSSLTIRLFSTCSHNTKYSQKLFSHLKS